MDLSLRNTFNFEYDPFQISAICPSTSSRPTRRVNLPICLFLSRRDEIGRDVLVLMKDNADDSVLLLPLDDN